MGIVLTHNAKYKPMSFEDMIKPYAMATEEYRLLEKGIADLDTEAENLRSIAEKDIVRKDDGSIDKERSKGYAIKYMDYADSLDKQAEQLASRGLKGVNRKSLYDLQAQYKTNVKPIEDASKLKTSKSDEQRKARLANPNLRFDVDFSNIDLQQLIDNPDLGYNMYNLNDYDKLGIDTASGIYNTLSERITENIESEGQWYDVTKGISDDDIINYNTKNYNAISSENKAALDELYRRAEEQTKQLPSEIKEEAKTRLINTALNNLKETTTTRNNANYLSDVDRFNMNLNMLQVEQAAEKLGQKIVKNSDGSFTLEDDPNSLGYIARQLENKRVARLAGLKQDDKGNLVTDYDNPFTVPALQKYNVDAGPHTIYNRYTGKYYDTQTKTEKPSTYIQDLQNMFDNLNQYREADEDKNIAGNTVYNPTNTGWYFEDKKDKGNIKPLNNIDNFERGDAKELLYIDAPTGIQEKAKAISESYGIPIEAIKIEVDRDKGYVYRNGDEYRLSIRKEYLSKLNNTLKMYGPLTESEQQAVKDEITKAQTPSNANGPLNPDNYKEGETIEYDGKTYVKRGGKLIRSISNDGL